MSPPKTILLVESDPAGRAGLAKLLGRLGHTVRCAATGQEALEELRRHRPDLILLNPRAAEQDGGVFWKQYQQDLTLAVVPVVILPVFGHGDQADTLPLDVTHLQKPINLEGLLAAIGRPTPRELPERREGER